MKNKHKSLLSVIAITCAVGVPLSLTTAHELPVQAALSAPASYDINYQYNSTTGTWHLGNTSAGTGLNDRMIYTRTTDSTYFNYTSTANSSTHSHRIPIGLEITHTFNRSNTTWTSVVGGRLPSQSKIGSDATVGSIEKKVELTFDNQTKKDFILYLDISSITDTPTNSNFTIYLNTNRIETYSTTNRFNTTVMKSLFIPAKSTFNIYSDSIDATRYIDAWYLKDLGNSDSYDAGYDSGTYDGYIDGLENSNFLITAVESIIGMMVNFTFILFTLEIFGVSILSIVGVLFGLITIVWILKTIRG